MRPSDEKSFLASERKKKWNASGWYKSVSHSRAKLSSRMLIVGKWIDLKTLIQDDQSHFMCEMRNSKSIDI